MIRSLFTLTIVLLSISNGFTQKVGVVLSGGGALGFAHIGALRALEENGIPIDYITGTSAGALVGSMYASGWSPELMDSLVISEKFRLMSTGGIEKKHTHYYRQDDQSPEWINIKLTKDFDLSKVIPTNITNPILLDFESMANYTAVSHAANYNFDSLFVPFRCVASDVQKKEAVIFKSGHLNQAVRASMTYPGYLKPIKVDGQLMFDGGLYNNFPTDVMYDDFYPDIIIGINFSDSAKAPDPNDVFSQFKTMIINRQPSTIICENGILIEPEEPISIFSFDESDKAIKAGYEATMAIMDSIKLMIPREMSVEEINRKRKVFSQQHKALLFDEIEVLGVNENIKKYVKRALLRNNESIDLETLKRRYFWLLSDSKINFAYPLAIYNPETEKYKLKVEIFPEKPFSVEFGGIFSSKPINTGFVGLKYARLGRIGTKVTGSSHFGKYYGSLNINGELDFNFKFPFILGGSLTYNRWDYFRSFTTFFEESKPSYIIENEQFQGAYAAVPFFNFGKIKMGWQNGSILNNYYQSDEFSPSDTADVTRLDGNVFYMRYDQSTLNRKQFASKGNLIEAEMKYFMGTENTTPGSTSFLTFPSTDINQTMLLMRLNAKQYFNLSEHFSIGLQGGTSNLLTDRFLDNYTATFIASPNFQPLPLNQTQLYSEYTSHFFVNAGTEIIYSLTENIEWRNEIHLYQPIFELSSNSFNQAFYNYSPSDPKFITASQLVLHSPLGPLSGGAYYMPSLQSPWFLHISFGYLIHNKRFIK